MTIQISKNIFWKSSFFLRIRDLKPHVKTKFRRKCPPWQFLFASTPYFFMAIIFSHARQRSEILGEKRVLFISFFKILTLWNFNEISKVPKSIRVRTMRRCGRGQWARPGQREGRWEGRLRGSIGGSGLENGGIIWGQGQGRWVAPSWPRLVFSDKLLNFPPRFILSSFSHSFYPPRFHLVSSWVHLFEKWFVVHLQGHWGAFFGCTSTHFSERKIKAEIFIGSESLLFFLFLWPTEFSVWCKFFFDFNDETLRNFSGNFRWKKLSERGPGPHVSFFVFFCKSFLKRFFLLFSGQ